MDGLRHVLDALSNSSGSFIYVSSTGVYGQNDGGWVDETLPASLNAKADRPVWQPNDFCQRIRAGPAQRSRWLGIYGPDRVPRWQDLRDRRPIPSPAEGYLNLIYVDDAVAVANAAANRRGPLRIYNVSDGHPVIRREYFAEVAARLGLPAPQLTDLPAGSGLQARGTSSKRVCNQRMVQELGIKLRVPSYREGLAAALMP